MRAQPETRPHRFGRSLALLPLLVGVMILAPTVGGADELDPGAGYQAIHGRGTFRSFCSSCHGLEADGNGRVAEYLTIRPADLRRISERNGGEFPREQIRGIIDGRESVRGHGARDMPVWGDVFQNKLASDAASDETPEVRVERKIGELVAFLYSIQQGPEDPVETDTPPPTD